MSFPLPFFGILLEKRLAEDEYFHDMLEEQSLRRIAESQPGRFPAANNSNNKNGSSNGVGSTMSLTDKIELIATEQEKINKINAVVVNVFMGFAGLASLGLFTVVLVYLFAMTQGKIVAKVNDNM